MKSKMGYVLRNAFGSASDPGEALVTLWIFLTLTAIFGSALYQGRPLFEHVEDFGLAVLYALCIFHIYCVVRKHIIQKPA